MPPQSHWAQPKDDRMARLRAGEATSLVLLTATALGLASCPITEPLEIAETRAAVKAGVFGEDAYPQMLLPIGWAPVNADPLPSTPRRDLSEVVTRLDGSPLGLTADAYFVTASRSMSTCRTEPSRCRVQGQPESVKTRCMGWFSASTSATR